MVTVAEIKKDLPDWPDDVIEQWLRHFRRCCPSRGSAIRLLDGAIRLILRTLSCIDL